MASNGKILIIDDNPKNIQVAATILAQSGYEMEFGLDGKTGIHWLEETSFDLILLDVMMPEQDGFDVCLEIKSKPKLASIPIIFVTAKADRESMVRGFEVGGEDYILKPYDAQELLARIRVHLELKKNKEALVQLNNDLAKKVDERTEEIRFAYQMLNDSNITLQKTNEDLVRLEHAKHEFLNIIGHQVGGSLHGVIGTLQILKHKVDSKKLSQLIDRVDNSLVKLEGYVQTALRVTALHSANIQLKLTRIDVNKLIGFCFFNLDEKIRQKKLKINNQYLQSELFLMGEHQLLMSCFLSALEFIIDQSPDYGTITIESKNESAQTTIIFKNEKVSINELDTSQYFDFFSTQTDSNLEAASSLGFAKAIIESHKGEIILKNRQEGGIACLLIFNNIVQTFLNHGNT